MVIKYLKLIPIQSLPFHKLIISLKSVTIRNSLRQIQRNFKLQNAITI